MGRNGEGKLTKECDSIVKLGPTRVSIESDPTFSMVQRKIPRPKASSSMVSYEKSLETGECIEDQLLLSINGWLSPEGKLFSCRWQEHAKTVSTLGFSNEREAVNAGFIKLSEMHWHIEKRFCDVKLTVEQIYTINKWHDDNLLDNSYFNKNNLGHDG